MIEELNSFIHSFSTQLLSILILGLMLGTGYRILFGKEQDIEYCLEISIDIIYSQELYRLRNVENVNNKNCKIQAIILQGHK